MSVLKKTIFSMFVLFFFIVVCELVSRLLIPDIQQAPMIVERVMHAEIQYDWLTSDPVLFWKLAGDDGLVFRVEEIAPEQSSGICQNVLNVDMEDSEAAKMNIAGVKTPLLSQRVSDGHGTTGAPMPRLSVSFDRYVMKPVAMQQRPDIRRLVAIGDSCTFFGHPSWPKTLEVLLNCNNSTPDWEVINAGVPAYSSHQGLKLFQHYIPDYQPDVVTVYFGWNDHWLGLHGSDADHETLQSASAIHPVAAVTRRFRMIDALRLVTNPLRHSLARNNHRPFRVCPDSYRHNLESMVDLAEQNEVSIVFITAPQGFDADNPPEYLRDMGYFNDLSLLVETHALYNDIVRQTAISSGSILVDAASYIDALSNRRRLFLSDGIHLTDKGIQTISALVYQELISSSIMDVRVE